MVGFGGKTSGYRFRNEIFRGAGYDSHTALFEEFWGLLDRHDWPALLAYLVYMLQSSVSWIVHAHFEITNFTFGWPLVHQISELDQISSRIRPNIAKKAVIRGFWWDISLRGVVWSDCFLVVAVLVERRECFIFKDADRDDFEVHLFCDLEGLGPIYPIWDALCHANRAFFWRQAVHCLTILTQEIARRILRRLFLAV